MARPFANELLFPLFQKYVYGATPPDGLTVAVPSFVPAQSIGEDDMVKLSAVGADIVLDTVVVHEFPSVTVTV